MKKYPKKAKSSSSKGASSSLKRHFLSTLERSSVKSSNDTELEYQPSEVLDSYYDEENVIVDSPKRKKKKKKFICKKPSKKQKVAESSDESSDEEPSAAVAKWRKKKKRASAPQPAATSVPGVVSQLPISSGATERQTVQVDLQQLMDLVK